MSMANLQRMAMQMQQQMERAEQELREARIEGTAGGGVVKATVTGKGDIVGLTIDPSAVDPSDVDMLQDLIVAALKEAQTAAEHMRDQKTASMTGGLRLPGM